MSIDRAIPYYVGLCTVSLFTGIAYETGPFVLRPFDVMIGAALVVTVGAASVRGYARRLEKGLPYYLFAALYLYRGLSGLVMTGPILAIKELIQGFEFLVLIHLVAQATKDRDDRMRFLRTLYVGFGIIALGSALLHIANGQYSGYKYLADLGYTSGGAAKYAFGLFGLLALVFWVGDRRGKYAFPVFVLAIMLALLSGERKGWLALAAAGLSLYYAASNFRLWGGIRNLFRARSIAVAVVLVMAVMVAYNYGYSRSQLEGLGDTYDLVVGSNFDYAYRGRQDVGRYNGLVFIAVALSRHPVFGVGTERGKEAVDEIPNPGVRITTGHGEYQRYALENGLLGLFLYAAAWGVIWIQAVRQSKYLLNENYILSLFMIGFVVYSVIINMFMGGGAHNISFVSISIGLLSSGHINNKLYTEIK